MKYAIIDNNKVIDYITSDESYLERLEEIFSEYQIVPIGEDDMFQTASIGQYYKNGQYLRFMKIAPLTIEQYRQLFGQTVTGDKKFALAVSPDGQLCIGEDDIDNCTNTEFQWVKDLTLIDYTTDLPDITPPTMTGYGILIPTEAETLNLFPNNHFNLGGYEINLTQTSQGLAVDLGYLNWQGFRDEQDKPFNATIKASFSALWYELLTRYNNNEIIQLP